MKCSIHGGIRFSVFSISLCIFWLFLIGYGIGMAATGVSGSGGEITNIVVLDKPDAVSVWVHSGKQPLSYTPVKQSSPPALLLYFSGTVLNASETVFTPSNPVVERVAASAIPERPGTVRVEIFLKRDAWHEIRRQGESLQISFSKTAGSGSTTSFGLNSSRMSSSAPSYSAAGTPPGVSSPVPYSSTASSKGLQPGSTVQFGLNRSTMPDLSSPNTIIAEPAPTIPLGAEPEYLSQATRLQSVYAAMFGEVLKVFVGADGRITNYKSYTVESPARIVFDIFNIQSPYNTERVVPVNTRWVSQVRYHSYPDRVRVILDTQKAYLNSFSAYPVENGLLIQMGGTVPASNASTSSREVRSTPATYTTPATPTASAPVPLPASGPRATQVQSVYATQLPDGMLITVRGDGTMNDYRTSVRQNPPAIIVDIPGVRSIYPTEQSFPVDTRWVGTVRHRQYPDRVQVEIGTQSSWLSAYTVSPAGTGLTVRIGGTGMGGGSSATTVRSTSDSSGMAPVPGVDYTRPAWIHQVDIQNENTGKAVVVIATTRPVQYDIRQVSDRKIELKLLNTKLPAHYRSPIGTNRSESPVSQIIPSLNPSTPDTAVFEIALQESVPYFVDREGNMLKVRFEASSIAPAPARGLTTASASPAPQPYTPPVSAPVVPVISTPVPSPANAATPATSELPGAVPPVPAPASSVKAVEDVLADTNTSEDTPQYTGEKIALDFFETDIKNVFRILKEVSGKNFAVDKDVTGKVTLSLGEPVPWDQVLDLVLKMNQLGKTAEGNIIRVATRKTLDEEEKLRQEKRSAELSLKDQEKQVEPVKTEYIAVNYSNAQKEIQPHLEKLLTKDRGSVSVDDRTNMVIMTDTAEKLRQAKELVRKLDRVTPQVIIEARVVEADTTFNTEIGTQWQMGLGIQEVTQDGKPDSDDMKTGASTYIGGMTDSVEDAINSLVGTGPERGYNNLGGTYGYNMGMNFPVASTSTGSFGFNFTRIAGTPLLLNAKLQAMESKGEVKIVSAPKVVTLDNKKAVIKQGISYPYQTVENGEVKLEFKDIDLLLEVTPHVTPDNRISMNINITKNDIGADVGAQKSFTTKGAQTELLINDGDTVVIGGIIKTREDNSYTGIPGLSRLPLIGWLFKSEKVTNRKEELLIFITPRIVQLEQRTAQF